MLVDLARRLEARGIPVALGHRGKLGLVAAHDGVCVTIETDTTLSRTSLRESLRAPARDCCAGSAGTTCACTRSSSSPTPTPSPHRVAEPCSASTGRARREVPSAAGRHHVNRG